MGKFWSTKKLGEIILSTILITVLLVLFAHVFIFNPAQDFWNNAMGNLLGTVVALIAGIPVALWIDKK